MFQGTLFIISAPSGAGKSSLINALIRKFNLDDKFRLSISHTTREPRPGEVDHESYHFVSISEFEELIARNAFLEYANVFGNYYGTSREIIEEWLQQGKDVLFDIDWQGARNIKEKMPEAIKIFILPPSLNELQRRLLTRGQDSPEVISKRMAAAMSEISHYDEYDYIIVNDDFDTSLLQLRSIILSTRCRTEKVKNNQQQLFTEMQRQADEYQEAWMPCATALAAALAAAKQNDNANTTPPAAASNSTPDSTAASPASADSSAAASESAPQQPAAEAPANGDNSNSDGNGNNITTNH